MLLSFMAALVFHHLVIPTSGVDFLFNSFHKADDLLLVRDAQVDSPVILLTTGTNRPSIGRVFLQKPLQMTTIRNTTTTLSSFSTSFVFSILAEALNLPGFGIAFVLSNTTDPPSAISGQYFGLFSRSIAPSPLLAVEFDTGYNPEFNDPNDNHVGIDLNIGSAVTKTAGYWQGSIFVPIQMRSGRNIRAWIDFNGPDFQINVTLAPLGISRPSRPLISYTNPDIRNYISDRMFVGFSASKVGETWLERQRILAWSFADQGRPARELNTSNLPVFLLESASSSALSPGAIAGITSACFVLLVGLVFFSIYWFWWRRRIREKEMENVEEWELEYWPHRFSYEELCNATKGFSREHLLGYGGFGKVYKGVLMSGSNSTIVAVKCIAHNSKQGVREFMAEISSMGRLQHKNLVQLRGWCRRGTELMLVYDYMPNGSLNTHIFDDPEKVLGWEGRRQVLADVAEGLLYLHHGWDQMVLHRDIKSSNILLDSDGRGRLGDFGLAKLYEHGQVPGTTRVVGTLGYLAPELAHVPAPTPASDVYSFGVVMLEVASGRRPIGTKSEDDPFLIDWVRELYSCGKILEAADERLGGEYKAEEMETVLKLGLACCHPEPDHRPTMKEVVAVLVGEEATPAGLPGRLLLSLPRQSSGEEAID